MTYEYTCPICKREFQLKNIRKRVFCPCGGVAHNPKHNEQRSVFSSEERQLRKRKIKCKHRGETIRGLECGCDGNPQVYQCSIHGECAILKLSRMPEVEKRKLKFCNECSEATT